MSTPRTSAPRLAAGNAVVPSPHPRSITFNSGLMPRLATMASPLSRMLAAMRVKSPFSHSAWFGFGFMTLPSVSAGQYNADAGVTMPERRHHLLERPFRSDSIARRPLNVAGSPEA